MVGVWSGASIKTDEQKVEVLAHLRSLLPDYHMLSVVQLHLLRILIMEQAKKVAYEAPADEMIASLEANKKQLQRQRDALRKKIVEIQERRENNSKSGP